MQRLVPDEYKIRFGDVDLDKGERSVPLHPDTVLLREPGLYCFLLRCNKDEADPFFKWVVKTVLPREVRKLSKQIIELNNDHELELETKNTEIALLTDNLGDSEKRIQKQEYENVGLQGEIRVKDTILFRLQERHVDLAKDPGLDNVVMIVRKHNTDDDLYSHLP